MSFLRGRLSQAVVLSGDRPGVAAAASEPEDRRAGKDDQGAQGGRAALFFQKRGECRGVERIRV